MTPGWAGPVWGEPSSATRAPVLLRSGVTAADAGYRADGGFSEHFAVLGASVVGVSHRLAGRRCDDAFGWALASPEVLVVAVADGVSGAARGGEGAELAVAAACEHVVGQSAHPVGADLSAWAPGGREWGLVLCLGATMAANEALFEAAAHMECERAELSTTLVVAALAWRQDGAHADIARLGDSTAFVLSGSHWEEIVPENPAEADEEGFIEPSLSAVLPGARADELGGIQVSSLDLGGEDALVLVTDGLANPMRDGPTTVAPALAELLAKGPGGELSPLALAHGADFSRRGCQDDRTIVAAWALDVP